MSVCQTFDSGNVHALIWMLAYQCPYTRHRLNIPDYDCSIVTATGEYISLRAENYRPDTTAVPSQNVETLGSIHIPQTDRLIVTATGKNLSIRVESN